MTRRDFLPIMTAGAGFGWQALSAQSPELALATASGRVEFDRSGAISSFTGPVGQIVTAKPGRHHLQILFLGTSLQVCDRPTNVYRNGGKLIHEFRFEDPYPIQVQSEKELNELSPGVMALRERIILRPKQPIRHAVLVQVPINLQLPHETRNVFLPMKNGVGRVKAIRGLTNGDDYVYRFAGSSGGSRPEVLAFPMAHEFSPRSEYGITHCTDPLFTSLIRLPFGDQAGQIQWIYPADPGLAQEEVRTIYTVVHKGGLEGAIDAFYKTALAQVKPGPDWLHDIAMADYDYLSKNGRGWFADIEKLEELIPPRDRSKVVLALHAWYDLVGQYTFNPASQSLSKKWIALPSSRSPEVQALGNEPNDENIPTLLDTPGMRFSRQSLQALEPVPMSVEEVHRRIRFAKDRGFRVLLYFADGLNLCEGATGAFDPTKVLRWGGWQGPDTKGRVCTQNPLHPEVRRFYREYASALMHEYGGKVDGFIWDETFVIRPGEIGAGNYPGYADRAFMTLMQEVASIVAQEPGLALLASDDIGMRTDLAAAPYCLMAHGTYQDSHCRPEAWPYGLFPNYRNTLWSCNWAPVTNFELTKYGVETFDTPVAISNGSFGDDIGISEMSPEQVARIMGLFASRKDRRMQINWIEEKEQMKYKGASLSDAYNIM
ncbi:MAG: hypothetical protein JOZ45_00390 [Acidobacteriaceae bacterium]|nr:hypothetical protein [Acidobacteriaceae bacterium]MBV9304562.1 hypothetical protein [Acidobacteriaceae bacterium]